MPNKHRSACRRTKQSVVKELIKLKAHAPETDLEFKNRIRAFAVELGLPECDGDHFYAVMMRNEWKFAGIKIEDWRQCMTVWRDCGHFKSQRR